MQQFSCASRLAAALFAACASMTVGAVPVTLDFEGVFGPYVNVINGVSSTHMPTDTKVTGAVTFDIEKGPPAELWQEGPDLFREQAAIGTPLAQFVSIYFVTTDFGTFRPRPIEDASLGDIYTSFNYSGPYEDQFDLIDRFVRVDPYEVQSGINLSFYGNDLFPGGTFPSGTEVFDFARLNRVSASFWDLSLPGGFLTTGVYGGFEITALSVRPASVSEPSTIALLAAAYLVGLIAYLVRGTPTRWVLRRDVAAKA